MVPDGCSLTRGPLSRVAFPRIQCFCSLNSDKLPCLFSPLNHPLLPNCGSWEARVFPEEMPLLFWTGPSFLGHCGLSSTHAFIQ